MKRRRVLKLMAGSSGAGLAGCTDLSGDESDEPSADDGTTEPEATDDQESTEPADDSTPENDPPTIVDFEAEPAEYGRTLRVFLEGQDNRGIERAAISYGDLGIEETTDDTSVTVEGELDDIHEAAIEKTADAVVFTLEDVEGEVTEQQERPHSWSPSVGVKTAATAAPGELQIDIEADDDIGLHWVGVELNGKSIDKVDAVGTAEAELDMRFNDDKISPGDTNGITVTARNTFGNTQRRSQEQYVREFEPLESQGIEIGAFYLPFFDDPTQWRECTDAEPEIGQYSMSDEGAVSRHIDLMQGFGISRMMHQFTVPGNSRDFLNTLDNSIAGEMPLEVYYNWSNAMSWRGNKTIVEQFEDTTSFMQREFLERENYNRRDEKPVVTLWGISGIPWAGPGDEVYEAIHSEWGGYEGFADFLYDSLETDGEQPYLVGMINGVPDGGVPSNEGEMLKQFDAATNWTIHVESGESIEWADAVEQIEEEYNYLREFADNNEMDFIPTAYLGFDDRANNCWGENRVIERAPSNLEDTLHLAESNGTTDRINIATFNDWPEGHMVEPGVFRGEDHGTEYLATIKSFVS